MARTLRLESENGVYHVISRGNYLGPVFRSDRTKRAFLACLDEACTRTGWVVHAWCVMTNHYHLALSTPRANLGDGMRWLQGTFANRFNRYRGMHGRLFQGRYKSFPVEPGDGLGALSHYIHLNPVRAKICPAQALSTYRWTSLTWVWNPKAKPAWFDPRPAFTHAGGLAESPAGRARYLQYLEWLAEDEPAQKRLRFDAMSRGWSIGSDQFARTLMAEHRELASRAPQLNSELQRVREAEWSDVLDELLRKMQRTRGDLLRTGKSEPWKIALALLLRGKTTATNRWLGLNLHLGAHDEVSRKLSAWRRHH